MSDLRVDDLLGLDEEEYDGKTSELRVNEADVYDDPDVPLLNPDPHTDDEDAGVGGRSVEAERYEDHCHTVVRTDGDRKAMRQLMVVSAFCTVFMFAEIVGGLLAKSLAIATDATHLACDLAGFLISLFAIWLSHKKPSIKMSFGYYRAEVLGALASVLIIWAVTAVLVYLAIERIRDNDYDIQANPMMITAGIGVAFNIIMGLVLHGAGCEIRSSFGHGHSHGSGGHGHSHGGHSNAGHSDGGHGHSHGGHSNAGHSDGGHGHSHGGHSDGGHGHSHGGHSHAGHTHGAGHSHGAGCHGGHTAHQNGCIPHTQRQGGTAGVGGEDTLTGRGLTLPSPHDSVVSSDESVIVMITESQSAEHVRMSRIQRDESRGVASAQIGGGRAVQTSPEHSHTNINVRAAMIHVIGDLIQSIGVFIAAIIIKVKPEYKIADPICTFIFSVLVLFTTINVLKDIVMILMQGVPRDTDYRVLKRDLEGLSGVKMAHSLNVWSLTMDKIAIGVHLAIDEERSWQDVLDAATTLLRNKHKAIHTTIQVERYNESVMLSCKMCQEP